MEKILLGEKAQLSQRIRAAEAEHEAKMAGAITLAAQRGSATAAADILARRYKERWRATAEVEHTGTVAVDVAEVRQRLYDRLRRLAVVEGGQHPTVVAEAPPDTELSCAPVACTVSVCGWVRVRSVSSLRAGGAEAAPWALSVRYPPPVQHHTPEARTAAVTRHETSLGH